MRRRSLLLVLVTLVAGCATVPPEAKDPEQAAAFHAETVADVGRACGSCHYGVGPVWETLWHNVTDDDGSPAWDLEVRAKYPTAPLWALQLYTAPPAPVPGDLLHDFTGDGPWRHGFQVEPGTTGLLVRFMAHDTEGPRGLQTTPRYDYPTALVLVDPAGAEHPVTGPEGDLKATVLRDPAPGAWSVLADVELGDAPSVQGVLHVSTWNATDAVLVDGVVAGTRLRFPDAGGRPPDLHGRVWPYHDHAPYEFADWDEHDLEAIDFTLTARPGPTPSPFAWTDAAVDPFWDGDEVVVQEGRTSAWVTRHEERGDGRDDPVFGKGGPWYYVPAAPLPPGTGHVRVEVTWTPPTEEPDLMVRVGPRGDARYHDMEAETREPGRAVFVIASPPSWWDVRFEDGEPVLDSGSLDVAPYFVERVGETVTRAMEMDVRTVAVRGPVPG